MERETLIDGKYRLGKVVGSGGMGTVYEAVNVGIGRRVALKLLQSQYVSDPKIVERFHQEAHVAASTNHDNICEVTDFGVTESGAPYLVMPLLGGRSLTDFLAGGQRSILEIADIACQTLDALDAAHASKIIHRDLKPDNIFLTRIGEQDNFVKLLDFGISKVLEQREVSELTATGVVLGTAFYLAPEQARGEKMIDHRVDIYAMGVILYEALTGKRPFEGESYNEVIYKITATPYPPPSSLNPAISGNLEKVILKAMSLDPAERWPSAKEMREALEQAVVSPDFEQGSALVATNVGEPKERSFTPTGMEHVVEAGRRRVGRFAAVALIAVVAIAGGVIWMASRFAAEEATPRTFDSEPESVPAPVQSVPEDSIGGALPMTDDVQGGEGGDRTRETKSKKNPKEEVEKKESKIKKKTKRAGKDKNVEVKGRFGTTFFFEE